MVDTLDSPLMMATEACIDPEHLAERKQKTICELSAFFTKFVAAFKAQQYSRMIATSTSTQQSLFDYNEYSVPAGNVAFEEIDIDNGMIGAVCDGSDCDMVDEFCEKFREQGQINVNVKNANNGGTTQLRQCGLNAMLAASPVLDEVDDKIYASNISFEAAKEVEEQLREFFRPMEEKLERYLAFNKTEPGRMNSTLAVGVVTITSQKKMKKIILPGEVKDGNLLSRRRRQASGATCSLASASMAQALIEMSNNGQFWMSWYVVQDVVYAWNSILYASFGLPAPLNLNPAPYETDPSQYVCVPEDVLEVLLSTATTFYRNNAKPLYLQTIVGSPSYTMSGKNQHSTAYGIDLQCGSQVYTESYGDCPSIAEVCSSHGFGNTVPLSHENGCGQSWWPLRSAHCSMLR